MILGVLPVVVRSTVAAMLVLTMAIATALAQTGAQDQAKQPSSAPADPTRNTQREFNEAAQAINGPAGNPECVWLGRNAVQMMLRDDLDTAFRHLDLYDRFGCPGGHIQATFRCVARSGIPDVKETQKTRDLVHSCWVNPASQPAQPAAATAASPAASPPSPAGNGATPPAAAAPAAPAQPANPPAK